MQKGSGEGRSGERLRLGHRLHRLNSQAAGLCPHCCSMLGMTARPGGLMFLLRTRVLDEVGGQLYGSYSYWKASKSESGQQPGSFSPPGQGHPGPRANFPRGMDRARIDSVLG